MLLDNSEKETLRAGELIGYYYKPVCIISFIIHFINSSLVQWEINELILKHIFSKSIALKEDRL